MKTVLIAIVASVLLFITQAVADVDLSSSCDGLNGNECSVLAVAYDFGRPPFPIDNKLAQELMEIKRSQSFEACMLNPPNPNTCLVALNSYFGPTVPNELEDSELLEILRRYIEVTEQRCQNGDAYSCSNRADVSSIATVHHKNIELLQEIFGAESLDLAFFAYDRLSFNRQADIAATREANYLREKCAAGDANNCGELGILLHEFESARNTPYEHVKHLVAECLAENDFACGSVTISLGGIKSQYSSSDQEYLIYETAIAKFTQACEGKDSAHACFVLSEKSGRWFSMFSPSATDTEKREWLNFKNLACENDHPKACRMLGEYYHKIFGKDQNQETLSQSVSYLDKACLLSEAFACHMLKYISGQ